MGIQIVYGNVLKVVEKAESLGAPLLVYSWVPRAEIMTRGRFVPPMLCFVAIFGYWNLNMIAVELENPFGDDPNDLPLIETHSCAAAASGFKHTLPCPPLLALASWR